ncbi:MAG: hypothetical protein LBQ64_05320 [Bacteroidales bacterium]|jgi:hypothetical protein|nr:hypothetical protein [Bacteroidales bacterium]
MIDMIVFTCHCNSRPCSNINDIEYITILFISDKEMKEFERLLKEKDGYISGT